MPKPGESHHHILQDRDILRKLLAESFKRQGEYVSEIIRLKNELSKRHKETEQ